jgi:hypothetical protein
VYNVVTAKDLPKSHQSYDDNTDAGLGYWYILQLLEPTRGACRFFVFCQQKSHLYYNEEIIPPSKTVKLYIPTKIFQKPIDKLKSLWYTCKAICFTAHFEVEICLKRI